MDAVVVGAGPVTASGTAPEVRPRQVSTAPSSASCVNNSARPLTNNQSSVICSTATTFQLPVKVRRQRASGVRARASCPHISSTVSRPSLDSRNTSVNNSETMRGIEPDRRERSAQYSSNTSTRVAVSSSSSGRSSGPASWRCSVMHVVS